MHANLDFPKRVNSDFGSILIYSDKLDYCFEYKKAIQSKNNCYNPFAFELNSINSFILYRPIDTNYNAFLFFKTDFGI